MNDDRAALAAEIRRLLTFTQTFSKSFDIRRTRVRNWRLMGIVMELEKAGRVNPRLLRQKITPLIPKGRSTDALHQTQYRYVAEFQNPHGEFLTPVYKKPSTSKGKTAPALKRDRSPNLDYYELNSRFQDCEYKYVSTFLGSLDDEVELKNVDLEKTDPRVRLIFKTLLVFQRTHYLPLWLKLVEDIEAVCVQQGRSQTSFDTWAGRDPTWVMLLSIWLEKLNQTEKWLSGGDINSLTVQWLVFPSADSVDGCLDMLADETGCKFLLKRKGSFEPEYTFNLEYEPTMLAYSKPLVDLRVLLRKEVALALRT